MSQVFQFDFVKCLVQTLRPSVAMTTDLSFHFLFYRTFVLSKSILIIFFKLSIFKQEPLAH